MTERATLVGKVPAPPRVHQPYQFVFPGTAAGKHCGVMFHNQQASLGVEAGLKMPFAIKMDGLTKRHGSFVALNDLTLEIEQGEIIGFLGHNGAGKTTMINIGPCGVRRNHVRRVMCAIVKGIDVRLGLKCEEW
jgi:ABC-type polysaccharide/polyol phosphate transport system ATPase subunit